MLGVAAGAVVLLASGLSAGAAAQPQATAKLLLDDARLRPELALTPEQRSRGLMHRSKAPRDGMLFVFREDTSGAFWMKNTLVPLSIVFFDAHGRQVRRLSMTPCRRDPCRHYLPNRDYRFALELPAGAPRPAKRLGPLSALQRLIRAAR
jgi:uncharacterized membrane protein (UPF0127 family)